MKSRPWYHAVIYSSIFLPSFLPPFPKANPPLLKKNSKTHTHTQSVIKTDDDVSKTKPFEIQSMEGDT